MDKNRGLFYGGFGIFGRGRGKKFLRPMGQVLSDWKIRGCGDGLGHS